jgi:hypothetical protein
MTSVVVISTLSLAAFGVGLMVFASVRVLRNYVVARWKNLPHLP